MDQGPDNPLTNQLASGIDEGKLLEAVRRSGYPLQSLVAQELSSRFTVVEEWGYTDRTTKEHRALDIYAFRELSEGGPRLHLLVECKRSEMPFIFFPPGAQREPWDFPAMFGFERFSVSLGNKTTQDASPATFFRAEEMAFASSEPAVAITFAKAERKSSDLELSGQVPFNQVILPLASALDQMRQIFGQGSPIIVLTMCVVDAPMLVGSGSPEAPRLCLRPWVRVFHQETRQDVHHWRWRHYSVDFVHRGFLSSYIDQHALPFAEALAKRVVEYRSVSGKPKARPKEWTWDRFIGRSDHP